MNITSRSSRPPVIIIPSTQTTQQSQDAHIDATAKKGESMNDDDDDDAATSDHPFANPVFSSSEQSDQTTTIFHKLLARFPTNPSLAAGDAEANKESRTRYHDAIVETKMAFDAACEREDRLRATIQEKISHNLNVSCARIGRLIMAIDRNESIDIDDYCRHSASPIVHAEDDDTNKNVVSNTTVDIRKVGRRKSSSKRSQLLKGLCKDVENTRN
jgi:hypothetical protein